MKRSSTGVGRQFVRLTNFRFPSVVRFCRPSKACAPFIVVYTCAIVFICFYNQNHKLQPNLAGRITHSPARRKKKKPTEPKTIIIGCRPGSVVWCGDDLCRLGVPHFGSTRRNSGKRRRVRLTRHRYRPLDARPVLNFRPVPRGNRTQGDPPSFPLRCYSVL